MQLNIIILDKLYVNITGVVAMGMVLTRQVNIAVKDKGVSEARLHGALELQVDQCAIQIQHIEKNIQGRHM